MILRVSLIAREILPAALERHHKKHNQDCASLCRRLGHDEKQPKEALGVNEYLQGVFAGISADQTGEVDVEIATPAAARELMRACTLWIASTTKKADNLQQEALPTEAEMRKGVIQGVVQQLADWLTMPVDDVRAMMVAAAAIPERRKKGAAAEQPELEADSEDDDE